jgi:hypothetical protein
MSRLIAIENIEVACQKTFFLQENNNRFIKIKEARFLDVHQLNNYNNGQLKIKNPIFLKPKKCIGVYRDYGYYMQGVSAPNELKIIFEYSKNYHIDFFIPIHEPYYKHLDGIKISTNLLENKVKNKRKVYLFNDYNQTLSEELLDFSDDKEFLTEIIRIIILDEVEGETYIYGAQFQLYPKKHTHKRFIKLNEEGKILDSNTSSWACTYDNQTSLLWENKVNKDVWLKKNIFLNNVNKLKLCGFNDWRLPNTGEIHSISNSLTMYTHKYKHLSSDFFTYSKTVWAKSMLNSIKEKGYVYRHWRGGLLGYKLKSKKNRVLLVRGKETIPAIYYPMYK